MDANSTFKLGFITGLTGPYAQIAANQVNGAELAVEEANARGGVNGRKVELLVRDDKLDLKYSEVLAKELIERDGAMALAGTISAATQIVFNEAAKKAGIPFFSCAQSNQITTHEKMGPYTFHQALTPHMTGQFLVRWGYKALGPRWVSIVPDYEWGHESYASSKEILEKMGGTDLAEISVPMGATIEDYEKTFAQVLSLKPDVLSVRNFGQDQVNFVKAVARTGLKKELPILIGISETLVVEHVSLDELVGMYWGSNFYWGLEEKEPNAKNFVGTFRDRFSGALPTGYASYAYTAVSELLAALSEAGFDGSSYEGMREHLESRHYTHTKGAEWWRPCDHQAFQDFYVMRFKGPEESAHRYDVAEVIDAVPWDLSVERGCEVLGHTEARVDTPSVPGGILPT